MNLQHVVIAVLTAQLGADDFRVRERADAALRQLGTDVHSHLLSAESRATGERSIRATKILNAWYRNNADSYLAQYGTLPWVVGIEDKLPHQVGQFYLEVARKKVGMQGPPRWDDYRLATKLVVTEMIANRVSEGEIESLIQALAVQERLWCAREGHRYQPAVVPPPDLP